MATYFKNLTNGEIRMDLFGVGEIVIPASAKSVELDASVADAINKMTKPNLVLEQTDVIEGYSPIVNADPIPEPEVPNYAEMTKAELKALLDKDEIKYHRDANKAELLDLLGVQEEGDFEVLGAGADLE